MSCPNPWLSGLVGRKTMPWTARMVLFLAIVLAGCFDSYEPLRVPSEDTGRQSVPCEAPSDVVSGTTGSDQPRLPASGASEPSGVPDSGQAPLEDTSPPEELSEIKVLVRPEQDHPQIVCARPPSPYVAVNENVYDVTTGEIVGRAQVPPRSPWPLALSADGKYFAFAEIVRGGGKTLFKIGVIDCDTGGTVRTFEIAQKGGLPKMHCLAFTRHNHLFAAATHGGFFGLFLWDVGDGDLIRQWPARFVGEKSALSGDGKYFATQVAGDVSVFNIVDGQVAATMARPALLAEGPTLSGRVEAIAFSPDGTELAGLVVIDQTSRALVVWAGTGAVVDELPAPSAFSLTWLPDGSGWVTRSGSDGWASFGEAVISRPLRACVWRAHKPGRIQCIGMVGQSSMVFFSRSRSSRAVFTLQWPYDRIREAVECVESGNAVIAPGQAVAVKVDVGDVRFADKSGVAGSLAAAVTKRLQLEGFQIVDASETTMSVTYTEVAAGSVSLGGSSAVYKTATDIILELNDPLNKDRQATMKKYQDQGLLEVDGPLMRINVGRNKVKDGTPSAVAEATVGALELSFTKKGSDVPVWRTSARKTFSGMNSDTPFNNSTARDSMFEAILWFVDREPIPIFLPDRPDILWLPIVRDITAPAAEDQGSAR